ncbi:hypothetical protein ACJMQP_04245 [Rhodopseudomonas palustris]
MSHLEVANTILDQLGGRRFVLVTGAKNLMASPNECGALTFQINGRGGVNRVRITLTAADNYTLEFMKVRGCKVTTAHKAEGVYCDMLHDVFEAQTGLYASL